MKKRTYFDKFDVLAGQVRQNRGRSSWRPGKEWSYPGRDDYWGLSAEGLHGTDDREPYKERVDLWLKMWGHPQHGVLLIYQKYGGGYRDAFTSKRHRAG